MFLIESQCCFIACLNVKGHQRYISCLHTVLDSLVKQFRCDTIPAVRFKYCDCHDVASMGAIFQDVFLAWDGTHEDILYICKLGIPLHLLQIVIKVLSVNHWQSQVVQDTHLLEVLIGKVSEFDIESGLLPLWLLLVWIIEYSLVWGWK